MSEEGKDQSRAVESSREESSSAPGGGTTTTPTTTAQQVEEQKEEEPSCFTKAWKRWRDFYAVNEFVILVICAILLARAYPPLGADYLQPDITSTWSKLGHHLRYDGIAL